MTDVCRVVASTDQLGETPLWCPRSRVVWWIDIEKPKLQSFDPRSGEHRLFPFNAGFLGSIALRRTGGLLVALDRKLYTFDPDSEKLELFCAVESDDVDNRLNDGRCDADGRLWIGTMDNKILEPTGAFYSVAGDGTVTRHFGDVRVTNSVAISPDQTTLYFSDTRRFTLYAFDLDVEAGVITNRRVFVDYTATRERPDGACVDADGFIWNAIFGGGRVVRYAPDGTTVRTIKVPVTHPTCVCFGGPELDTLYITTARKFLTPEQLATEPWAGSLLATVPGVKGLPEQMFAG
jgi:sugar lactone lactonase YvrE